MSDQWFDIYLARSNHCKCSWICVCVTEDPPNVNFASGGIYDRHLDFRSTETNQYHTTATRSRENSSSDCWFGTTAFDSNIGLSAKGRGNICGELLCVLPCHFKRMVCSKSLCNGETPLIQVCNTDNSGPRSLGNQKAHKANRTGTADKDLRSQSHARPFASVDANRKRLQEGSLIETHVVRKFVTEVRSMVVYACKRSVDRRGRTKPYPGAEVIPTPLAVLAQTTRNPRLDRDAIPRLQMSYTFSDCHHNTR
eukprot:Colp12_sorted_trinity150504_noHs@19369